MDKIIDCWQYSKSLNKFLFQWDLLPYTIEVLAGTDTSGIVVYHGTKYHVSYDYLTNLITIERY